MNDAFGRLQTYVNDVVGHRHLGLRPDRQGKILATWAMMEKLDRFVGVTHYQRERKGAIALPFPPDI